MNKKSVRLFSVVALLLLGVTLFNTEVQKLLWLRLHPSNTIVQAELRETSKYAAAQDAAAQLPHYLKALQADPNSPALKESVAECLVQLGRFEDAERFYSDLAQSGGPWSKEARQMLKPGKLQLTKQRYDQAKLRYATLNAVHRKHYQDQVQYVVQHGGKVVQGRVIGLSVAQLQELETLKKTQKGQLNN